jgi:hypothetical protein
MSFRAQGAAQFNFRRVLPGLPKDFPSQIKRLFGDSC